MYYVIDLDNVVTIGGEKYLIDFLLLPTWKSGMNSPIWNRLYVRIDPTVPEDIPPYCTQRRLVDNGPVYYYHPCVPFDVMQSRCSNWISWGDVRIRHESGLVGREETISLLRIKSGIDLQQIQQSPMTDLCFVIEGKFPSNSTLNWNQWLFPPEKQEQCRKGMSSSLSDDDKSDSSTPFAKNRNGNTGQKAIEYLPLDKFIKHETDASSSDAVEPNPPTVTTSAKYLLHATSPHHHDGNPLQPTNGVENTHSDISKASQNPTTTAVVAANGRENGASAAETGTNNNNNNNNYTSGAQVFATVLDSSSSSFSSSVKNAICPLAATETVDLPQEVGRIISLIVQKSSTNTRIPMTMPMENAASLADMHSQSLTMKSELAPKPEKQNLRRRPIYENADEEEFEFATQPRIIEGNVGGRSTVSSAKKPRYRSLFNWNNNNNNYNNSSSSSSSYNNNNQENTIPTKRMNKNKYPITNQVRKETTEYNNRESFLDDCFDADESHDQEGVLIGRPDRRFGKEKVGPVDDEVVYENGAIDQRAFVHSKPPAKRWKTDSTKQRPNSALKIHGSKLLPPQNNNFYTCQQQKPTRPNLGNQTTNRRQRRSSISNPGCSGEYGLECLNDEPASQYGGTTHYRSKSVSDDEGGSSSSARDGTSNNRLERQMDDSYSANNKEWNHQNFEQPVHNTNFRRSLRPYHETRQPFFLSRSPKDDHFDP